MTFFILRALGEMAIHHPVTGSFAAYATHYVNPFLGYLVGWGYWFYWTIIAIAEVTAVEGRKITFSVQAFDQVEKVGEGSHERVVIDALSGRIQGLPAPDVVVCVVDATNLQRNLFLASQIADAGIPLIIALNLVDSARGSGLRIDSEFEGVVNCPDTLVVGKTGVVKAEINVKNAIIGGKVVGNINATNKIELQSGSHIEGDIQTHRLVIDEGVFFEGSCKMGGGSGEPETRTPSTSNVQSSIKQGGAQKPAPEKVGV